MALETSRSEAYIGSVNLIARAVDRLASLIQVLVVAVIFGVSRDADIYFLAGIVPLTIGTIVGDPIGRGFLGILVQARSRNEGVELAAAGLFSCSVLALALAAAYVGVAIGVVEAFAPGGSSALGPWLAFAAIAPLLALSAYFDSVLLWLERYAWAAARMPLLSLCALALLSVAAATTHSVTWSAAAVSGGFLIATVVLAFRVGVVIGQDWMLRSTQASRSAVAVARNQLLPSVAGGMLGGQVIVLVERALAGLLGVGSVAMISYARGLAGAPLIVSQAIGASALPGLARAEAEGSTERTRRLFLVGLRLSLVTGIGLAAFLTLFSGPVTDLLLRRGALGAKSAERAGHILAAFGPSVAGAGVLVFLTWVMYGTRDARALFLRALAVFALYLVTAPILLLLFSAVGLAAAFSVAEIVGAGVALALVSSRLNVGMREILRVSLRPAAGPLAVVLGALGAYRLLLEGVDVSGRVGNAVSVVPPFFILAFFGAFLMRPQLRATRSARRLLRSERPESG